KTGITGGLIVILVPASVGGTQVSGEMERPATPVAFMAVTIDDGWHQIVARSIARLLGLAYEGEEAGPTFLQPANDSEIMVVRGAPNLLYYVTPPSPPLPADFPWLSLVSASQRTSGLTVVPHPGSANV